MSLGPIATLTNAAPEVQLEVKGLMQQVLATVSQSQSADEVALVFSQKIVQLLFLNSESAISEVYIKLLQKLCEMSRKVAKELSDWFLYNDDEVTMLLACNSLIECSFFTV
jgi:CCR4-NOT transcription complex subunit 1